MNPVFALVGRPNVGKSTLFNRLTCTRDALVANQPGLTRDRIYGKGRLGDRSYSVIDTGGLSERDEGIDAVMAEQSWMAAEEADAVLFLVDGREGLSVIDEMLAMRLRCLSKPLFLVVNKTERLNDDIVSAEFQELGLGEPVAISSAHGEGVRELLDEIFKLFPEEEGDDGKVDRGIKLGIIGRPNVGKSTLVNRMLGEERVVVFDEPGTTRDSVFIPFVRDEQKYTLIDTAGVRRRSKVNDMLEKFSVIKTLKAIEESNVIILVLDAHKEVSDQDARLLGYVLESGRALIIAVNKWDGLNSEKRKEIRRMLDFKLSFVDFARIHFISALHGTGVGDLFKFAQKAYRSAMIKVPTPRLTQILEDVVEQNQPPLVHGRRIKLRYAHQGGKNPPLFIVHGNQTKSLPDSYKRFLENTFTKVLRLEGTPVRFQFKSGKNPYARDSDKKPNLVTPRQKREGRSNSAKNVRARKSRKKQDFKK